MKYLVNLDLNQNEIQNAVIQPLATAPSNPVLGQVYFNTTSDKLYQYDGTAWVCVGVTYDMAAGNVSNNTVPITLTGSDGTTDTINITGAGGTTLTKSGNTITITTSNGVVTDVQANGTSIVSDGVANIPLATTSSEGLMSGTDKTTLASRAPIASPAFTGTPTAPTAAQGTDTTQIATTAFVNTAVSEGIAASDAMRFKGTIGTGGTVTTLPTTDVLIGDTYRVITAGTYDGHVCEIGDLIIAIDTTPEWTVAQTNIDGAITNITGTSPITVSGSGASRSISLAAQQITPQTYVPAYDSSSQRWYIPAFYVTANGIITFASSQYSNSYIGVANLSTIGFLSPALLQELMFAYAGRKQVKTVKITGNPIAEGSQNISISRSSTSLTVPNYSNYIVIDSLNAYSYSSGSVRDEILVDWSVPHNSQSGMDGSYIDSNTATITASWNDTDLQEMYLVVTYHTEYVISPPTSE